MFEHIESVLSVSIPTVGSFVLQALAHENFTEHAMLWIRNKKDKERFLEQEQCRWHPSHVCMCFHIFLPSFLPSFLEKSDMYDGVLERGKRTVDTYIHVPDCSRGVE